MNNLIKFIKENKNLSVNIVPTGSKRKLQLVVLTDNEDYKKLIQRLGDNHND